MTFSQFAECPQTQYCQLDQTYSNGRLSWHAEATADELFVKVQMSDPCDADEEFLRFHMMDESGNEFPLLVNTAIARRSNECVDWAMCCTLAKQEVENGWEVTCRIPRALFPGKNRILFGLELVEYRDGKESNITWPPGKFEDELRLLLGYFTPDRLVMLEL